jgi:glucosamine--fructose-6-phosphate aminotransferase (isomerizing)
MCGIVGYSGSGQALPVLLQGMRRLEYRGYDSAGIAILKDGVITTDRRSGHLSALVKGMDPGRLRGHLGIGHTRWATHGEPSQRNAHPHLDCTGRIAVVHNGIIENHDTLRDRLRPAGHRFRSDTDTEVVAHLLESILERDGCDLREAILEVVTELEGAYALVCVSAAEPESIFVARRESPIVVGVGDDLGMVGSDIPALLEYTRDVVPLENRRIAEVRPGSLRVWDFEGREVTPEAVHVEWDSQAAERGGFEDFMLKEIHEQPEAVRNTVRGRVGAHDAVQLDDVGWDPAMLQTLEKVVIVACGSSFHAGMAAKHSIEHWARIPVELDLASEFRYRDPILDDRCLVIGITQSGETADTLAALRYARDMNARVAAVTNVVGSSITRDAEAVIFTHAGPEIGVAATKTFVAQLTALNLLALYLAQKRRSMPPAKVADALQALQFLPEQIEDVLMLGDDIHRAAKRYATADNILFIGRGVGAAVAMEGALKLKEISYIHAEGYPAGELKHGAIALVDDGTPVVAVLTGAKLYEKVLANVQEVRARGAETILLAPRGDDRARGLANELFEMPPTKPLLTPILDTIPLQLFAYYIAKERGLSPDMPRNLAKSVTVE